MMKVLNVQLAGPYTEGFGYQENILTKYHARWGYDTHIIASPDSWKEGKRVVLEGEEPYTNKDGVKVVRLPYRFGNKIGQKLKIYKKLYKAICAISPDVMFVHGCQFADMKQIVKYLKKHPDVRVYVDNHADYANSASNWVSKNILHKILWRHMAKLVEPFTTKFYGVLPARVDFLVDMYGLPKEKCELLVMGADDDCVEAALKPEVRQNIRQQYGLKETDYVIITGGKIDHNKPQTLDLMEAVNKIEDSSVKLLVFGSVIPELKERFDNLLSDRVIYIGWKKSEEIYGEFAAADLIAFPGLHSVLWEQAAAMGRPCAFRKIKGFQHIDLGGNCVYFEEDTIQAYVSVLLDAKEHHAELQNVAIQKGKTNFSYKQIAKKSLEE